MERKPKFKPVITRVKLNPEQAVLQCSCYDSDWNDPGTGIEIWACAAGQSKTYAGKGPDSTPSTAFS